MSIGSFRYVRTQKEMNKHVYSLSLLVSFRPHYQVEFQYIERSLDFAGSYFYPLKEFTFAIHSKTINNNGNKNYISSYGIMR